MEKTKGWIMVRRIGGKNGLLGKTVGYANSNQPWKLNVIPLYYAFNHCTYTSFSNDLDTSRQVNTLRKTTTLLSL